MRLKSKVSLFPTSLALQSGEPKHGSALRSPTQFFDSQETCAVRRGAGRESRTDETHVWLADFAPASAPARCFDWKSDRKSGRNSGWESARTRQTAGRRSRRA